jgi:hypothetical protein
MVDSLIRLFDITDTDFTTNGIGSLSEATKCTVTEERNGEFTLEMEYPIDGIRYNDIHVRRIIVCRPNPYDNPQAFRIYKIERPINGYIKIHAAHISYDLSNWMFLTQKTNNAEAALHGFTFPGDEEVTYFLLNPATWFKYYKTHPSLQFVMFPNEVGFENKMIPFNYVSDIWLTRAWDDYEHHYYCPEWPKGPGFTPASKYMSLRSLMGGDDNGDTWLSLYGGEMYYDNFTVYQLQARGKRAARGDALVTIRYGKNMTSLDMGEDDTECYNAVIPIWGTDTTKRRGMSNLMYYETDFNADGTLKHKLTPQGNVPSGETWEHPDFIKPYVMDLNELGLQDLTIEEGIDRVMAAFLRNSENSRPSVNIKVEFESLVGTSDYENFALLEDVKLCDEVIVIHEPLGIHVTTEVVKTEYDVIAKKYSKVELGEIGATLADTLSSLSGGSSTPTASAVIANDIKKIVANSGRTIVSMSMLNDHTISITYREKQQVHNGDENTYEVEYENEWVSVDVTEVYTYSLGTDSSGNQNGVITVTNMETGETRTVLHVNTISGQFVGKAHLDGYDSTSAPAMQQSEIFNDYIHNVAENGSHAEGWSTTAVGAQSHSEGRNTYASGGGAHAEGGYTSAFGAESHAEGYMTTAFTPGAHAEGYLTYAGNQFAEAGTHAEGNQTCALGGCAHAEGYSTCAAGYASHAEGEYSKTPGSQAHAEGRGSIASGDWSHAEGYYTTARGTGAHSEGYKTCAGVEYSHTEGYMTYALSIQCHAEGHNTTATGGYSHAEGQCTWAGVNSHAEGFYTCARDEGHAEGAHTTSWGQGSHAEGYKSYAGYSYSHAEGDMTTSLSLGSHSEGIETYAYITAAHAEGENTTAYGRSAHAEGYECYIWAGTDCHAEGTGCSVISTGSSHAEGAWTYVGGAYSHAEGYATTILDAECHAEGYRTYVSEDYSHAEGFMTSCSSGASHTEGNGTRCINTATTNPSITGQHSEGYFTYTIGSNIDGAHSEGKYTYAGGIASHAEGNFTSALGSFDHAEGSNNNITYSTSTCHAEGMLNYIDSGSYQHIEGYTNTLVYGNTSHVEGALNYVSSNDYVHMEGVSSYAYASAYSHVEGFNSSLLYSMYAHIEGTEHRILASSVNSHFEGKGTTVIDQGGYNNCHVEGVYHYLTGGTTDTSHIEGERHFCGYLATCMHLEGYANSAMYTTSRSHLEGSENVISYSSKYCHIEGVGNTATYGSEEVHIEGRQNRVENTTKDTHVEGYCNTVTNNTMYSHIGGFNNSVSGPGYASFIHGESLKTYYTTAENPQIALGRYNDPGFTLPKEEETDPDIPQLLMTVGNGTADDARSNAFAVLRSGGIVLPGDDGFYYSLTVVSGVLTLTKILPQPEPEPEGE